MQNLPIVPMPLDICQQLCKAVIFNQIPKHLYLTILDIIIRYTILRLNSDDERNILHIMMQDKGKESALHFKIILLKNEQIQSLK